MFTTQTAIMQITALMRKATTLLRSSDWMFAGRYSAKRGTHSRTKSPIGCVTEGTNINYLSISGITGSNVAMMVTRSEIL